LESDQEIVKSIL